MEDELLGPLPHHFGEVDVDPLDRLRGGEPEADALRVGGRRPPPRVSVGRQSVFDWPIWILRTEFQFRDGFQIDLGIVERA